MPCQCGCTTAEPRAGVDPMTKCECGCTTEPDPAQLHLARLVSELDQRLKKLETTRG